MYLLSKDFSRKVGSNTERSMSYTWFITVTILLKSLFIIPPGGFCHAIWIKGLQNDDSNVDCRCFDGSYLQCSLSSKKRTLPINVTVFYIIKNDNLFLVISPLTLWE